VSVVIYHDDAAYICHEAIVNAKRQAEENFLRMGEKLYEVILFKYYRQLGYRSFPAYCASIDISRSMGYTLAQIHETFVLRANRPAVGLLEVGSSKLALLAARVESGDIDTHDDEQVEGWLNTAEVLARSDLITELRAAFGDETGDTVNWHRKAHLWKAVAKKYYRRWLERRI